MATSYNGWPASRNASSIGIDANFSAAGRKFPGGVKSGDVAVCFRYLVIQFDARVEELDLYAPGDEWGYYYKPSANNPRLLSCHSSGTALDLNATRHPNGRSGTFKSGQVVAIRQILRELNNCIRWGGDFTGTKDEMHFEIYGGPAQVKVAADRIRNSTAPSPITPLPEDDDPMATKDYYLGEARVLFRTFLGRNPNDQAELDLHAWALAAHGFNGRCQQLADSAEGKAYEEKLRKELATPDV